MTDVGTHSDDSDLFMEFLEQEIILSRCKKFFFIHEYGHVVIGFCGNPFIGTEAPSVLTEKASPCFSRNLTTL